MVVRKVYSVMHHETLSKWKRNEEAVGQCLLDSSRCVNRTEAAATCAQTGKRGQSAGKLRPDLTHRPSCRCCVPAPRPLSHSSSLWFRIDVTSFPRPSGRILSPCSTSACTCASVRWHAFNCLYDAGDRDSSWGRGECSPYQALKYILEL